MTATLVSGLAGLNCGQLCPPVLLGLGPASAQLEANLSASLSLQASASIGAPQLTVQLQALEQAALGIEAGIAAGLPGVTFSVSAAASLVANAQAALGALSGLLALLTGPSAFVYSVAGGTVGTIGSDLTAGISGTPPPGTSPSDPVAGILVAATPASWTLISPFFGGL